MRSAAAHEGFGLAMGRGVSFDAAVRAFALSLLPLVALACAPVRAVGPGSLVNRYSAAIEARDAQAVWALLDEDARAEVGSPEAIDAYFAEAPDELSERAGELRAAVAENVQTRAEVADLENERAEPVVLVLEDDAWRLVGGFMDTPALQTPVDAIRALRHALQRRSLRGLLRVLSRDSRRAIEADLDGLAAAASDEYALEISIEGNEGLARLPDGLVLRLVRESGEWHVVGLDLPRVPDAEEPRFR